MSLPVWPAALPTYQIDEAAHTVVPSVIRDSNPGQSQQRRVGNTDRVTFPARFEFGMVQSEIFEYFVNVLCSGGTDWFVMPVARGDSVTNTPVRIVNGQYNSNHDGHRATITCELEFYR